MMGARTSSPQERTRGGQAADYTGRRSPGEASGGINSAIRWREVGNGVDKERQWGRISIVAIRVWRLDAGGMARALRVDVAGAWYPVTNRGHQGAALFLDDADRQRFFGVVAVLPVWQALGNPER